MYNLLQHPVFKTKNNLPIPDHSHVLIMFLKSFFKVILILNLKFILNPVFVHFPTSPNPIPVHNKVLLILIQMLT